MSKKNPKTGLSIPVSLKKVETILPLPSKTGCGICYNNMHNESYNNSLINESLSSKDKIVNLDNQIYKYERIQNDTIPNHVINLKKLRQIEVDKIEQKEVANTSKKIKLPLEQDELQKVMEKITFQGGKGDFVKNSAHYYFNPNNPDGLRLSVKQIPHIAKMLGNNFKAEDGSFLTGRTTRIGLRQGFNMDKNGVISIK